VYVCVCMRVCEKRSAMSAPSPSAECLCVRVCGGEREGMCVRVRVYLHVYVCVYA